MKARITRLLKLPVYRLTYGRTIPSERRVWPMAWVRAGRLGIKDTALEDSYAVCPN